MIMLGSPVLSQEINVDNFVPNNTFHYSVETVDGKVYYPDSIVNTSKEIIIVVNSLRMTIPHISIQSIKVLQTISTEQQKELQMQKQNHLASRYFVGSSALPMEKGDFQFHNVYLFFNNVNYGLTDKLSIGIGLELLTTFLGGIFEQKTLPTALISPKYSFEITNDFHGAVGGIFSYGKLSGIGGIGYGAITYGNAYHNVTTSVYSGILDINDNNIKGGVFFSVSGMSRLSKYLYVVTENYVFPQASSSALFNVTGTRIIWDSYSIDSGVAGFSQPYFAFGIRL